MIVLAFDTETSGLVPNRTIKLEKQPHIIEFYGCQVDLSSGEVLEELDLLIKPPNPLSDVPAFGDKKTTTQITGITNEMLADAPSFKEISEQLFSFIERAPLLVAHNLSYDMEMLDIEAERLNRKINWPPGLCTVEQTIHLKGHRLTLDAMHELLIGEKFSGAHRAKKDVQAMVRCLVELHHRNLL